MSIMMHRGKKKTIRAAKTPNVALKPTCLSMGGTKKGAVYDNRFLLRLKTRLASAPWRGYDSKRYVWLWVCGSSSAFYCVSKREKRACGKTRRKGTYMTVVAISTPKI